MLGLLFAIATLGGCGALNAGPERSDACACTLTPAPYMRRSPQLTEGAVLGFEAWAGDMVALVEFIPHAGQVPQSLFGWLDGIATTEPMATNRSEPTYVQISGREAAWQDMDEAISDLNVRKRYLIVDNGAGTVIVQVFALQERWDARLPAIEQMVADFALDGSTIEEPFEGASPQPEAQPLLKAREAHETRVRDGGGPYEPHVPPSDGPYELVRYQAEPGDLRAYLTRDPGDGQRHPAVLWIEGGFGGPSRAVWTQGPRENDQSAVALQSAGFVVMAPSFRGELDNPGRGESWYGETRDLLAALEHLRGLSYVDPERVYLMGHSTGGTHVLLAAVATDQFRAAFAFGGRADLAPAMADGGYEEQLFDPTDATEVRLRSAVHWAGHIERPVHAFEGEDGYHTDFVNMAMYARAAGKPMEAHVVPAGDHFTILAPMKELLVQQMLADTGPEPSFSLPESALHAAMRL